MNYIQKRASLRKIASLKKAAAAVLLIKLAAGQVVDLFRQKAINDLTAVVTNNQDNINAAKGPVRLVANNLVGAGIPGYGAVIGGGGGAVLGGLTGALLSNEENRFRDGLLGALTGGVAGGIGGYSLERGLCNAVVNKLLDENIYDPLTKNPEAVVRGVVDPVFDSLKR